MMDFLVRKRQLETFKFSIKFDPSYGALSPGEVLFELKSFGLSQTNIAYAQYGDSAGFWGRFPSERGWGSLPVWGFAEIVRSRNAEIAEGDTFFGCFPISMRTIERVSMGRRPDVFEAALARRNLPFAYGEYQRIHRGCRDPRSETMNILFRPSFETAMLIAEFLRSHDYFAARSIVVTSAECKTALCLAFLLSRHVPKHFTLIGLTAHANVNVAHGPFDQLLRQDEPVPIPRGRRTIVIDFADRACVLTRLTDQLAGNVACVCRFGHGSVSSPDRSAGATDAIEFSTRSLISETRSKSAPDVNEVWALFVEVACAWIDHRRYCGYDRIAQTYLDLLTGRSSSQYGYILNW